MLSNGYLESSGRIALQVSSVGWHAGTSATQRFDPTQYVREQRERRRLAAERLHRGLPAADVRASCSAPRTQPPPSVRSGEAVHACFVCEL